MAERITDGRANPLMDHQVVGMSTYPFVYLSIHPSVYLSIDLSTYLPIYLSTYLSIYLASIYLSIDRSILRIDFWSSRVLSARRWLCRTTSFSNLALSSYFRYVWDRGTHIFKWGRRVSSSTSEVRYVWICEIEIISSNHYSRPSWKQNLPGKYVTSRDYLVRAGWSIKISPYESCRRVSGITVKCRH